MSTVDSVLGRAATVRAGKPATSGAARWFYAAASASLLLLTVLGFQHYYVHGQAYPGRPIPPPIRGLIVLHGLSMSAWMVLLVVQAVLVPARKFKLHMALGQLGAVLAGLIVVLGLLTATRSSQVTPPEAVFGMMTARQFMVIPFTGILFFGIYVAIGLTYRKRPDIHRAMLLVGTLAAVTAAMDRIDLVHKVYSHTAVDAVWGPYFPSLVLGAVFLAASSLLRRSLDRWLAIALAALAVASAAAIYLAKSPAWEPISRQIAS